MFYTEILMLINSSGYSIQASIPFSVYGESLIILFQNFLIVLMFWVFSKEITAIEKLVLFGFFSGYSFVLFSGSQFLTKDQWELVQKSNLALSLISRVPQILSNFQNKSTGQLAFFTFLLSFLGVLARLGTVLMETDNFLYQLQYILSATLNGIIVLQFILYWNNSGDAKKVGGAAPTGKPSSGQSNRQNSTGGPKKNRSDKKLD